MQVRSPRSAEFSLKTERLGPLPLINHFIDRMGLAAILDKYVATTDPRCRVSHAKALGVLLRSIVVEREPIYRAQETVHGFATGLFGVAGGDPKLSRVGGGEALCGATRAAAQRQHLDCLLWSIP